MTIRVLYVGDSEIVYNQYLVGADVIASTSFNDNGRFFRDAMEPYDDIQVEHLTPHDVPGRFPTTDDELARYDVVVFSDVGYNSMTLYAGLAPPYEYPLGPDRVAMVRRFVEAGGGFIMVGGYLSFAGLNGVARWHGSDIEAVLPVTISTTDDRVERTEGFRFRIETPDHPLVAGLPWENDGWTLCGYNRVTLRTEADLISSIDGDPMMACWDRAGGRTAVFCSDFAPHWAGSFVRWEGYGAFWAGVVRWLAGSPSTRIEHI